MMVRSGWFRFNFLCAVLSALFHLSVSQPQVNLPVRPVVTELGLLQGKCPLTPVSPSGALRSGSGRLSGSGIDSGSSFPSVQSGSSGAPLSSTSVSASGLGPFGSVNGFSGVLGSASSASGVSGVSEHGSSVSGSGDVCFNLFQAFGLVCAAVLQADLCQYEYSSQTCNICDDLFLSCGPPEGDIVTFCGSEMAQRCSKDSFDIYTTAVENSFDYCALVWRMCYLGTNVEYELCLVEGLVGGCTNLLINMYQCECFLPSSQCSLCTSVVSICEPPTAIPPSAIVDVNDLTTEQAENSVTIVFGGIMVTEFNASELQFRMAIAAIVNQNILTGLPRDRPKRQTEAVQNVTAENVFIVGPSPLIAESGLQAVFFVQTNNGAIINGTELTEAVRSEGPTLAREVGANFRGAFEGIPVGFGQPPPTGQPTVYPTILLPSAVSTMAVQPSSAIGVKPQQPTPLSSQSLRPPDRTTGTTEAIQPTMAPPQPTETTVSTQPPHLTGQLGEGDIAAIVVVMSIATVVILVVSAVFLYCIQRRRRKYKIRIGSGSKYYGKYIHGTNTFGRPSITSDMGKLAGDDIPMEKKIGTLPFTAVVATNPIALEPDVEIFMLDRSGEFRQNGETEADQLEDSIKETQL